MKLKWTKRALHQLIQAQDYISQDDPAAARQIAQRIVDAAKLLLTQPNMGRPGRVEGTREWVVQDTPYLIAYCVEPGALQVVGVIHSKQRWPEAFH